ncbi:hypothetical protein DPMN_175277 [Dreissena polymorpha]|uniref:Uncharacterized protein n=1 Tax=Dreissena polymorpha TaxID=45954 RepID=A0A9D4E7Y1_DREPO|nr:hypothetical protein DPMN_175277 [Dreissena polymorpha]
MLLCNWRDYGRWMYSPSSTDNVSGKPDVHRKTVRKVSDITTLETHDFSELFETPPHENAFTAAATCLTIGC